MTPAIKLAEQQQIQFKLHPYDHDSSNQDYGNEAVAALGVAAEQVFKTLVVALDTGQLAVAVLPVANQLSLKLCAKAFSTKKASLADKTKVERSSGYVLGGVSPLGQKRLLPTVIDESAQAFSTIYISAGKRGLDIELQPSDLARLTKAEFLPLALQS
ncbi:MAG: Cys-tRNA(Pro) deacylase [Pseudomonadota bacterium]